MTIAELGQVLPRSEVSEEHGLQDIIKSTIVVIFLGTPHRGSADLANLADIVRKMVGFCLFNTNPVLLRTLGVDSPELELGRESFMKQWRLQNFAGKTFQEALPATSVKLGPLGEKVRDLDAESLYSQSSSSNTITTGCL